MWVARIGKKKTFLMFTRTSSSYFRQYNNNQYGTYYYYYIVIRNHKLIQRRESQKMDAKEQLTFLTRPGGNGPVVVSIGVLVPSEAALPPEITSTNHTTTCDKDTYR